MLSLLLKTAANELLMFALAFAILAAMWIFFIVIPWMKKKLWRGTMQKIHDEFKKILMESLPRLLAISEMESRTQPSSGKWSKKEILGHLIDSASNNHQRFVRAQLSNEVRLSDYEQEIWVKAQGYQAETWESLVQLWGAYNAHLLHLVSLIPEEKLRNRCFIGEKESVTLEFLIQDYIKHLRHHLAQILA